MYTKCVYTIPLLDDKQNVMTHPIRGTVYTKCVYTPFPSLHVKQNFMTRTVRGTVYTKCVCTVPVTACGAKFPYPHYKGNGVYQMCIHRSRFSIMSNISIITLCEGHVAF